MNYLFTAINQCVIKNRILSLPSINKSTEFTYEKYQCKISIVRASDELRISLGAILYDEKLSGETFLLIYNENNVLRTNHHSIDFSVPVPSDVIICLTEAFIKLIDEV